MISSSRCCRCVMYSCIFPLALDPLIIGPCPGYKIFGLRSSCLFKEEMYVDKFSKTAVPCPKIESPVNNSPVSSMKKTMWSVVWPGVWTAVSFTPSTSKMSPSLIGRYSESSSEELHFENVASEFKSLIWLVPPTWSRCQCVSNTLSIVQFSSFRTLERTDWYFSFPSPVSIKMRFLPVPIRYVFVPELEWNAEVGPWRVNLPGFWPNILIIFGLNFS